MTKVHDDKVISSSLLPSFSAGVDAGESRCRCLVLGVGAMGDQTIDTYLPFSSFMDQDL